jgi:hypothetical protein
LAGIVPLRKISEEVTKPQVSVALAQALGEIEPEIEIYSKEANKILRRYWKDVGGGVMNVLPKDREAFDQDTEDLQNSPVSLNKVGRYKLKTLADAGATISGDTLYKLGWMIKTDDVAPTWDEAPEPNGDRQAK